MPDYCDPHCPFLGCASCEYAGGAIASAGTVFGPSDDKMGVRQTAPAGNRGLTNPTVEESKWL